MLGYSVSGISSTGLSNGLYNDPNIQSGLTYEQLFKRYGQRFLAHIPQNAKWLSAQAWQESRHNPNAVSHAGAMGVMQIMPRTFAEISAVLGVKCAAFNARCSIMFGAYYDSRMYRIWAGRDRTVAEVIPLMLSSYNCGAGCVINAQKKANNARNWHELAQYLPKEARDYPVLIRKHYLENK